MIWVAWRQQRLQILVSVGLVLLAAAVVTSVRFAAVADLFELGISGCWSTSACVGSGVETYADRYRDYVSLNSIVGLVLPAVMGVFAGAPMFAREVESGTHIFGLTQSVSRTRWWTTKALVGGTPVVLAMTGLGLLNGWALGPLGQLVSSRMMTPRFGTEGLVFGAYTLLALAIGIAAGLWLRSTVVAMGLTLALYVGALAGLANDIRPFYAEPVLVTASVDIAYGSPMHFEDDPWMIRQGYLDAAGNEVESTPRECSGMGERAIRSAEDVRACLQDLGFDRKFVWYHPGSRFWTFQVIETGLVILVSAMVLAIGAVAVRFRLG